MEAAGELFSPITLLYIITQHNPDAETGLDYCGARFYDSEVARFLSLDPLAAAFPSWSPYNYVLANPLSFTDPDGRSPKPIEPVSDDNAGGGGITKTLPEIVVNSTHGKGEDASPISYSVGKGASRDQHIGMHDFGGTLPEWISMMQRDYGIDYSGMSVSAINAHYYSSEFGKAHSKYVDLMKGGGIVPITSSFMNSAGTITAQLSDGTHVILDVIGTFDQTGIADLLNAGLYLAEGDLENGTISLLTALPGGDVLKLTRGGKAVRCKILLRGCFVQGTFVLTSMGEQEIEDIPAGEKVWVYNAETGELMLVLLEEVDADDAQEQAPDVQPATKETETPPTIDSTPTPSKAQE